MMLLYLLLMVYLLDNVITTTLQNGQQYTSISITQQPADLVFLNTVEGSITCQSTGLPQPTIVWVTEAGLLVTDVPQLRTVHHDRIVFHHFDADRYDARVHNTKYRCKVASLAGEIISRLASVRAELDIRYSPSVHHQSVMIGSPAIFKCNLPSSSGRYIRTNGWYLQKGYNPRTLLPLNSQSNGIKVLSTGELLVRQVANGDGDYKFACVSKNLLSNTTVVSSPAMLFIDGSISRISPRNIVTPQPTTVNIGEDLHLNCYASSFPPPVTMWYKDGTLIVTPSSNARTEIKREELIVKRVVSSDEGRYTCVIKYNGGNGGGQEMETRKFDAFVKVRVPLSFIVQPQPIRHLLHGQTKVTFSCQATGWLPIAYSWYKDGSLVATSSSDGRITMTSGSLVIDNVVESDEGFYQCFATNHFESIQSHAQLTVLSKLPIVTDLSADNEIVSNGDDVKVTCRYDGLTAEEGKNNNHKVTWFYEYKPLQSGSGIVSNDTVSVLTLKALRMASTGHYSCSVENRAGVDRKTVDINIRGKPVITDFKSSRYGLVGKSLSLSCIARGYPQPAVHWKRWGSLVTSGDGSKQVYSNGTLVFKVFASYQAGDYQCVARNGEGESSVKTVNVASVDPPIIRPVNADPVIAGSRVLITCICTHGSPDDLTLTWYKDGRPVDEIAGIEKQTGNIYTSNIFIERVRPEHHGRYTCIARNRAGQMAQYTDFVVYERAIFTIQPTAASTLYREPTSLACRATGFPTPQILWLKKSPAAEGGVLKVVALSERVKQLNNGTLHFARTTELDDGEYACKAFFDALKPPFIPEQLSRAVTLQVKVPARVLRTSPLHARQEIGKDVHLICAIVGTTPLAVKWFKNGAIISETQNGKYEITIDGEKPNDGANPGGQTSTLNSTLVIKGVSTGDNTSYECMGRNLYGSHKKKFYIVVEEKPSPPINVRKLSATPDTMLLSWTPGYDGNLNLTEFVLQIRKEDDEDEEKGSKNKNEQLSSSKSFSSSPWEKMQSYSVVNSGPYSVTNLHPGTRYMCRVKAKNRLGFSDYSLVKVFSTQEKAPSSPPQNVTVTAIAKDKLLLRWKHPGKASRNGVLTRYQISYTPTSTLVARASTAKEIVSVPSVTEYTLSNLLQFTTYTIQIRAATRAGLGPPSTPPVFATTQEGVPSVAPPSVEAHALNAHQIVVTWKPIPQHSTNGLLKGYTVQYTDTKTPSVRKEIVVNGLLQALLTGLKAHTRYLIQVSGYTNTGPGVVSTAKFTVTDEARPGHPVNFQAIPANPKEIVLTWQPPSKPNGILLNYNIYFKARHDQKEPRRRVVQASAPKEYRVQNLEVKREYVFWMNAVTSKGEGNSTDRKIAFTAEHVPARIITPSNFVVVKPLGSDVSLPCTAVGFPKPSIVWSGGGDEGGNSRRWMAEDKPKLLYRISKEAEGEYNCTAYNSYGADWNIVRLTVQVPPYPPYQISSSLVVQTATKSRNNRRDDFYTLNITWVQGNDGGGVILRNQVLYAVEHLHSDWMQTTIPGNQNWFGITNVTYGDVIYAKLASENFVGVGRMTSPMKFIVMEPTSSFDSAAVVQMYASPQLFVKGRKGKSSLQRYLKPILISAVVFITLLMVLLLAASYDREENRIREPRCSRLLLCTKCTTCSQRKEYNPAPYSEPGLLWPWNIKRNRHSGAFFDDDVTMKDELLPIVPPSDRHQYPPNRPANASNTIEMMKYRDGTMAVMYNNHLVENGHVAPLSPVAQPRMAKMTNQQQQQQYKFNDFEPVVLFNPPDKMNPPLTHDMNIYYPLSQANPHHTQQQDRRNSIEPQAMSYERSTQPPNPLQPYQWISAGNRPETDARDSGSGRYDSTPSIIEKYFQSQEPYAQQQRRQSNDYIDTANHVFPNDDDIVDFNPSIGNRNQHHMNNRDSMLTEEESVDLHELDSQIEPPPLSSQNNKRSPPRYTELYNEPPDQYAANNGESNTKPSPPNYRDIISSLSDYSDAPRALFRKDVSGVGGSDQPSSRRAKRNRKSLDSLLLKTLEDIEEQAILTNSNNANNVAVTTPALERHVAIVREALQKATRSFDSVSSTCSSSVGELRRAFEFGKKYGLQHYGEIPDYLEESVDDLTLADDDDGENDDDGATNAFREFLEHEKLLDLMSLTNFSEQPKSLNDIEVKMPLPLRLNESSSDDDDGSCSGSDVVLDTDDNQRTKQKSGRKNNSHQTLSLV